MHAPEQRKLVVLADLLNVSTPSPALHTYLSLTSSLPCTSSHHHTVRMCVRMYGDAVFTSVCLSVSVLWGVDSDTCALW
jgi:hypothetical protein